MREWDAVVVALATPQSVRHGGTGRNGAPWTDPAQFRPVIGDIVNVAQATLMQGQMMATGPAVWFDVRPAVPDPHAILPPCNGPRRHSPRSWTVRPRSAHTIGSHRASGWLNE